jgi:hydrogenase nickel incorporation protein HypA/HybF
MHELSVCQGLLRQVEKIATEQGATAVERIVLRIGGLSGGPVVVKCQECGGSSVVPVNRLVCAYCGEWKVNVTEGEEMLLLSLDLTVQEKENV